jgi:hypothetical protein
MLCTDTGASRLCTTGQFSASRPVETGQAPHMCSSVCRSFRRTVGSSPPSGRPLATGGWGALAGLLLAGLALCMSLASPAAGADELRPASGVWPLNPRPTVVAPFEPPATRWGRGHRGADLLGGPAQVVRSALPGRVAFAGRVAGRGVVVVDHGGAARTTYEPVAATVRVGDRVGAGAPLGRLELFGSHCFPSWCLHWGYIEGHDHYLDPLVLVGAAPVILLPLYGSSGSLGAPGLTGVDGTGADPSSPAWSGRAVTRPPPGLPASAGLGVMRLGAGRRAHAMLGLPGPP